MEIIDTILNLLGYAMMGFVGLILCFLVFALLFGDKVIKDWEYEAKFYKEGKEVGELDMEYSMIEKRETEKQFKPSFRLKDASLTKGKTVDVFLDDHLILRGPVLKEGRIRLGKKHCIDEIIKVPVDYKECRVKASGSLVASGKLYDDR